jgi:hypothetical protein
VAFVIYGCPYTAFEATKDVSINLLRRIISINRSRAGRPWLRFWLSQEFI